MELKYLIVLSLSLTGCRVYTISDIIQNAIEEDGITCTPLKELPNEKVQCLHNLMLATNPKLQ